MTTPYIDIHSHVIKDKNNNLISIYSIFVQEWRNALLNNELFTIGLHPWHAEAVDLEKALEQIYEASKMPNCIGVGEIGLDRVTKASFEKQQVVFEQQLLLAKKLGLPVIIHSVRSVPDVLHFIKKVRFNNTFVFHGFAGNREEGLQIMRAGGMLSFGKYLANHYPPLAYSGISKDYLFFETDESTFTIAEIYNYAAQLLGIPLEDLKQAIYSNYVNKIMKHDGRLA